MQKDPEGLKLWNAMRDQWKETHEKALAVRRRLTNTQIACAKGKGPDPTDAAIEEVEKLEQLASMLSVEMDNFVKHRLG